MTKQPAAPALVKPWTYITWQVKPWTYNNQEGVTNLDASQLGTACRKAAEEPKCGDSIDRGLILLRELQALGYGIVKLQENQHGK